MTKELELRESKIIEISSLLLLSITILSLAPFTQIGKISYYLLFILSLYFVIKNYKKISIDDKNIKYIIFALLAWFIWTVISNLLNGVPELSHRSLWRREAYIVSIIPLYFLFRYYPPNTKILIAVIVLAAYILAVKGVHEIIYLENDRFEGGAHSIQLASIATLLFIVLVSILLFLKTSTVFKIFAFVALACLLFSVIISESRGVWVAYPVIFIVVMHYLMRGYSTMIKIITLILLSVALIGLYFVPTVKSRIDLTVTNIMKYQSTENVSNTDAGKTSIGTRFEMWKAGWAIFTEHPLIGVGLGGYQQAAVKYQDQYKYGDNAFALYHPHNQYISELSTKGLPGLILFLIFLFSLYRYFYSALREKKVSRSVYFCGIQAVILISILCLSNATFEAKSMVLAMSVYFALLASWTIVPAGAKRNGPSC